jgi:hypothetical protein
LWIGHGTGSYRDARHRAALSRKEIVVQHRPVLSSSLLKRAAVATAVVALGFASITSAQASVKVDAAHGTINTVRGWDHTSTIGSFGCPDTTTYGEVITIPSGKTQLNKFIFYVTDGGSSGSMVVRGEVYAWDGSEATGAAVYESDPQTVSYGDSAFHPMRFNAGGAAVTAGSQYVIFASIDKDYEQCTDNYVTSWGQVPDTDYPGGTFVFQNNAGDESQWTATSWVQFGLDLAFKATLR